MLDKCGGNLQAVVQMGIALKKRTQLDGWNVAMTEFNKPGDPVRNAIKASVEIMRSSDSTADVLKAARALGLLQHVQAQVRFPAPVLKLLLQVAVQAEDAPTYIDPGEDASMLLKDLVDHQIMCKVRSEPC